MGMTICGIVDFAKIGEVPGILVGSQMIEQRVSNDFISTTLRQNHPDMPAHQMALELLERRALEQIQRQRNEATEKEATGMVERQVRQILGA